MKWVDMDLEQQKSIYESYLEEIYSLKGKDAKPMTFEEYAQMWIELDCEVELV